jgi:hypothetical protein
MPLPEERGIAEPAACMPAVLSRDRPAFRASGCAVVGTTVFGSWFRRAFNVGFIA